MEATLEEIIAEKIEFHQFDLNRVFDFIENKFQKQLTRFDEDFLKRIYIENCVRFWHQETKELIENLKINKNKNYSGIKNIFSYVRTARYLHQIPHPFNYHKFYKMLTVYGLLKKEDERPILVKFKKEFSRIVVDVSNTREKEFAFLQDFVIFLNTINELKPIVLSLQLDDFCRNVISFKTLIVNIMMLQVSVYGFNLHNLQKSAFQFLNVDPINEPNLNLMGDLKKVLQSYLVEIQETVIEERLVIQVTGNNIIISEILPELESRLSENLNINEVHFVSGVIVQIDENLKRDIWHGKNIVIYTNSIKVHDQITWDVSGKDNDLIYSECAGTGTDGHGIDGNDGVCGESGGNVSFFVENIENPEKLTIISIGGKGGQGQNGGNGEKGRDGKGISKAEFYAKFRYPYSLYEMRQFILNLNLNRQTAKIQWFEYASRTIEENVIEEIVKYCEGFENYERRFVSGLGTMGGEQLVVDNTFGANAFIKASTNEGNEIIFSYEKGGGFTNRQSYFLYRGTPGKPGGQGGLGGLGAQGGYAGEIIINCSVGNRINKITRPGEDGANGKGGLNGDGGKDGWDMGYTFKHSYTFFLVSKNDENIFGENQSSKIELSYYNSKSPNFIDCPYKKRKGESFKYAELQSSSIEHQKQTKYVERFRHRSSNRQNHSKAIKNRIFSQTLISGLYSHNCNENENIMTKLRSDSESFTLLAQEQIAIDQVHQQVSNVTNAQYINRIIPRN